MKISIITVAYNEEKNISKTIESVLNQTSNNIEYIVCDGKSTDDTVNIAESYENAFIQRNIKYIVNSEKDNGIYYGMNRGIQLASGEYILFLNAGDWFYSNEIIDNIIKFIKEKNNPDFVYGNVATIDRKVISYVYSDDSRLQHDMSTPHPALFSSSQLMKENLFDTSYKIAADYNFVLSQKLAGKTFCKIEQFITYFAMDGISSKRTIKTVKERELIKKRLGVQSNTKNAQKYMYKEQILVLIKNAIPQKLWEFWSIKVKRKNLYTKD